MLNERALDAAIGCYSEGGCSGLDERERREVVSDIVAAYVSALLPEDVAGLVERLEKRADFFDGIQTEFGAPTSTLDREAASLIQSQAARIEELEAGLEPFADVADHDIGADESDDDVFRPMTNHNRAAKITVGHMRRTVTLLTKDRQP